MTQSTLLVACALALGAISATACGTDDSKVACEGKAAGDACSYGNAPPGYCEQDADDEVLECEHTLPGITGSDGAGGAAAGGSGGAGGS